MGDVGAILRAAAAHVEDDFAVGVVVTKGDDGRYLCQLSGRSEYLPARSCQPVELQRGSSVLLMLRPHQQAATILSYCPYAGKDITEVTAPRTYHTADFIGFDAAVAAAVDAALLALAFPTWIEEVPTGTVDGSNRSFTTSQPAALLEVMLRGASRRYSQADSTHFTLLDSTPQSGDDFQVVYQVTT